MRTMATGKSKAKLPGLLDERESVLVMQLGEPWAKLVAPDSAEDPLRVFRFAGNIEIVGDLMAPLYSDEENEAFFERSVAQLE